MTASSASLREADVRQPSDAELIERSWGEPEAFAVLFDRYAADIHHYAARRLGTGAADDLVAETFLGAFRRRTSYDTTRARARPRLYGIATTLIARQAEASSGCIEPWRGPGWIHCPSRSRRWWCAGWPPSSSSGCWPRRWRAVAGRPGRAAAGGMGRPVLQGGRLGPGGAGGHRAVEAAQGATQASRGAERRRAVHDDGGDLRWTN